MDSIGRIQSAEVIRTAEFQTRSQATSTVRDANNSQNARLAEIQEPNGNRQSEQIEKSDATTRRAALIAEERGQIQAEIAQAGADIDVPSRIEEVPKKIESLIL